MRRPFTRHDRVTIPARRSPARPLVAADRAELDVNGPAARYTEMITSEAAQDAVPGFVPYRRSWLSAGRRLLAPFGRQSAAGQFADAYADLHAGAVIFPEVPDAVQALARHVRIAVVANADHDYLMRCLNHNDLRFAWRWLRSDGKGHRRFDERGALSWRQRRCQWPKSLLILAIPGVPVLRQHGCRPGSSTKRKRLAVRRGPGRGWP